MNENLENTKVHIKNAQNPPNKLADNIAIGPTPGKPNEQSLWELGETFQLLKAWCTKYKHS